MSVGQRWHSCLLTKVVLAGLAPMLTTAAAQPNATSQPDQRLTVRWVVDVAADEQTLWVVQVDGQRSQLFRRTVNRAFQATPPLNARIVDMVAAGGVLYVFTEAGEFWSLSEERWTRELDLPARMRPLHLTADGGMVYALILSPPAGQLPSLAGAVRPAVSQPFDAGAASLSVVRYDSQGWAAVAPCPPAARATGPLPLRIGFLHGALHLFWGSADGRRIENARFDPNTTQWSVGLPTPELAGLRSFWIATISRVPTLIAARSGDSGQEELVALRLLSSPDGAAAQWKPAALSLSPLPESARPARYHAALGFNQHVALPMSDSLGRAGLQFGRIDGVPTEPTAVVAEIFSHRESPLQRLHLVQGATLVILFAVLLSLFVLRRGAMVTPATLPEDSALALAFQRMIAWLVDFVPFGLAAAVLLQVDWQLGLRELSGWAAGSDAVAGGLPAGHTLAWWGITCGGHCLYCLVLELLTQRTVGKVLAGTRVLSETGHRPAAGQLVLRNLLRLLELLPPLWPLVFLVVLSRNRQRLGDMFARTVIVRRVKTPDQE